MTSPDASSSTTRPASTVGKATDGLPGPVARAALAHDRRETSLLAATAVAFVAAALALALLLGLRGDRFLLRLATEALILGGLALSVDILLGIAGLLSLGQALYFGLGAYVSALVLKHVAQSLVLALVAATATGLLTGLIGGLIALRARGVYFALITFGLAQVVAKIVYNTRELGASDGIIGIPVVAVGLGPLSVATDWAPGFFLLTLGLVAGVLGGLLYLIGTPLGRAVRGVRLNEQRMAFLGYPVARLKLAAYVLAAAIAALFGGLYPALRGFVSPELMSFEMSTNAIVATIIGGTGSLIGPLLGAMLLAFTRSAVGTFTEHHLMVVGMLFILVVVLLPRGIVGAMRDRAQRRVEQRRAGAPQ